MLELSRSSNISNVISRHYLSICHGPEQSMRQIGSCLENTDKAFGAARKGRAPITLQSEEQRGVRMCRLPAARRARARRARNRAMSAHEEGPARLNATGRRNKGAGLTCWERLNHRFSDYCYLSKVAVSVYGVTEGNLDPDQEKQHIKGKRANLETFQASKKLTINGRKGRDELNLLQPLKAFFLHPSTVTTATTKRHSTPRERRGVLSPRLRIGSRTPCMTRQTRTPSL